MTVYDAVCHIYLEPGFVLSDFQMLSYLLFSTARGALELSHSIEGETAAERRLAQGHLITWSE